MSPVGQKMETMKLETVNPHIFRYRPGINQTKTGSMLPTSPPGPGRRPKYHKFLK